MGCTNIAFCTLNACAMHAFLLLRSPSFLFRLQQHCISLFERMCNACTPFFVCGLHQHCSPQFERTCNAFFIFIFFVFGLHQHCIPHFEHMCNVCLPAGEVCLSEMGATAEASLDLMAMPTSAAARAARSLMPSPQYMHVFPKP